MGIRKKFMLVFCFLLLVLPAYATFAVGKPCNKAKSDMEKLRCAEETADKFVARFLDTLDFAVPYREFFTVDRTLRNRNARAFRGGANTKVQRVNDRTLDQMYIAFMNVYYLSNLWGLSTKRVKDVDEQLYPPEIVFAMKSSPYFRNWISEAACCNEGEEDVKTRSEVLGLVKDAHRISSLFRKRIPPNSMSSSMYKENAKGILHDSSSPRIKYGEPNLGVSDSRAVFIVERDLFYFYIFEEAGRFKVFGLGIGN